MSLTESSWFVNYWIKVNTKCSLSVDLRKSHWIPPWVREEIRLGPHRSKINKSGVLRITSQRFRSQQQNVDDSFKRLIDIVNESGQVEKENPPREKVTRG